MIDKNIGFNKKEITYVIKKSVENRRDDKVITIK